MTDEAKRAKLLARRGSVARFAAEEWEYPTGMVWCPMKMSSMAIMRCARLQQELGCGTLRELETLKASDPDRVVLFWPWLRRRGECPERATEKQIRELLLAVTNLKLVHDSGKKSRACRCPGCGGRKTIGASRCRPCWRGSVKRRAESSRALRD